METDDGEHALAVDAHVVGAGRQHAVGDAGRVRPGVHARRPARPGPGRAAAEFQNAPRANVAGSMPMTSVWKPPTSTRSSRSTAVARSASAGGTSTGRSSVATVLLPRIIALFASRVSRIEPVTVAPKPVSATGIAVTAPSSAEAATGRAMRRIARNTPGRRGEPARASARRARTHGRAEPGGEDHQREEAEHRRDQQPQRHVRHRAERARPVDAGRVAEQPPRRHGRAGEQQLPRDQPGGRPAGGAAPRRRDRAPAPRRRPP